MADVRINEQITQREVLLVGVDDSQPRLCPLSEALALAARQSLDLVEVARDSRPPVCRVMDYRDTCGIEDPTTRAEWGTGRPGRP